MQEVNSTNSLWMPSREPEKDLALASVSEIPPYDQDDPDEPESPICCWNICTGIHAPTSVSRVRRQPASD